MSLHATARTLTFRIVCSILLLAMMIGGVVIGAVGTYIPNVQASNNTNATSFGGCPLFPGNNIWNRDISTLPVHRNSANFINSIGITGHVHADFGAGLYGGGPIGIPYVVVPGSQPKVPVSFTYDSESDPGPYPIPTNAPIEGGSQSGGDRHVIVVNSGTCNLYEMFSSYPQQNGSWKAGSGAVWNLNSNALRPGTWTSADAAGLPILPGLARYDEVASGLITHALRFTVNNSQKAFLWPARHYASSSIDPNLPPMGLRLRLKASFKISSFSPQNRVILTALKHYGMIVADNGSSWFISGAPDNRWNNNDLHSLGSLAGSDFEAVDESSLQVSANSGQAGSSPVPTPTKVATHPPTATPTKNAVISLVPLPTDTPVLSEDTTHKDAILQNNGNIFGRVGNGALFFTVGVLGILLTLVAVFGRRYMRKRRVT
jgi:hypothetical protein